MGTLESIDGDGVGACAKVHCEMLCRSRKHFERAIIGRLERLLHSVTTYEDMGASVKVGRNVGCPRLVVMLGGWRLEIMEGAFQAINVGGGIEGGWCCDCCEELARQTECCPVHALRNTVAEVFFDRRAYTQHDQWQTFAPVGWVVFALE